MPETPSFQNSQEQNKNSAERKNSPDQSQVKRIEPSADQLQGQRDAQILLDEAEVRTQFEQVLTPKEMLTLRAQLQSTRTASGINNGSIALSFRRNGRLVTLEQSIQWHGFDFGIDYTRMDVASRARSIEDGIPVGVGREALLKIADRIARNDLRERVESDADQILDQSGFNPFDFDRGFAVETNGTQQIAERLSPKVRERLQKQFGANLRMSLMSYRGDEYATLIVSYLDGNQTRIQKEIPCTWSPAELKGPHIQVVSEHRPSSGPVTMDLRYTTVPIAAVERATLKLFGVSATEPSAVNGSPDRGIGGGGLGAPIEVRPPQEEFSREVFSGLTPATQQKLKDTFGPRLANTSLSVQESRRPNAGVLKVSFLDASYTRVEKQLAFTWPQVSQNFGAERRAPSGYVRISSRADNRLIESFTFVPIRSIEDALKKVLKF